MNTRRVPNLSASHPDAGISTAIASEYATMTECICSGLSPRSEAIAGSAVLTIVPSSVCMKKPRETSQSSLFRMGESGAAGWGVDMCKGIFQRTRCFEFATAIAFLLAP